MASENPRSSGPSPSDATPPEMRVERNGAAPPRFSSFAAWCRHMAEAEQGDGWLAACDNVGRFLAPCRELIDPLAELLGSLLEEVGGPVLEVCAGSGELAAVLRERGVRVVPIDVDPPAGAQFVVPASGGEGRLKPGLRTEVKRMSAQDALVGYRPTVVLGAFVPIDAGVDEAVMQFPTVRHYVVLGARIGGLFGSPVLWQHPHWTARTLDEIGRHMLTRHDVWTGQPETPIVQHGEAWHFRRTAN